MNCSGTVVGVEFCYVALEVAFGIDVPLFTLSVLEGKETNFTVLRTIVVRATPGEDCAVGARDNIFCCGNVPFNIEDQFQLPSSNFAYGLTILSGIANNLIAFNRKSIPLNVSTFVDQYQRDDALRVGETYTFAPGSLITDATNQYLALKIGK